MQRSIRAASTPLLFALLFLFFSFVSTFAGIPTPTPTRSSIRVPTRITPSSNSLPRAAARSLSQQYRLFLPLILNGAAIKPLPKVKTGIHLGNRDSDWTPDMLSPFLDNPTNPNPQGTWPKIIVAQSRQIFDITRAPDCRITGVAVKNWNAYSLLRDASRYNGTQIIIRITPSPGNFQESTTAGWQAASGRTMIAGTSPNYSETPGNYSQCDPNDLSSTYWENQFRTVADIGDEMIAIQLYVTRQYYSWQVWGFEPANEPNVEWYRAGPNGTIPELNRLRAWQDMDDYFANLYGFVTFTVHDKYPNLYMRVLTPPMAMLAYAEIEDIRGCDLFQILDTDMQGYAVMSKVFNTAYPSNDGYSWHNYFIQGKEFYAPCPDGDHVSWYFPSEMYYNLYRNSRPGVITEADLASAAHGMGNPITDKDANPGNTFNSINTFVAEESEAQSISIWLLNDNVINPDPHPEHIWHEAYDTDSSSPHFRNWFWEWWRNSQ